MVYDYLIVGAGLFGAVFANKMKEKGKKCLVIEKRDHIAGNIYTTKEQDYDVHQYGAHIFHTSNEEVWQYVNRFASFNHYVNSPIAVYQDEIYNLPFNMNTFSKMWKIKTPDEAKQKIESQREEAGIREPSNLEEQALKLVGRDVYTKLVKGYTEKQWGRDCRELPAFIIKRLPIRFTYDNNYFNDRYQGIPEEGYTKLVENLLSDTPVLLQTEYKAFLEQNSKKEEPDTFEHILYTGMIDEFFDYCYGPLEYRSLRFETVKLAQDNYQGNAVVNYTEREIPYTRIIEHKHFVFSQCQGTVITKEYPADWKPGDEPYYPINDPNTALFERYRELAKQRKDVIFGGRLGQYQYYDMDKVVAAALKTAESVE